MREKLYYSHAISVSTRYSTRTFINGIDMQILLSSLRKFNRKNICYSMHDLIYVLQVKGLK